MNDENAQATEKRLKPIPIPGAVLWSIFRERVVPVLVFGGVILLIWQQGNQRTGTGVPGVAEGVRAMVSSPQPGIIRDLAVKPYEWVEAGQPIATLEPADPAANLDLLRSEMDVARLRLEPSIPDRNALDFERLRVEAMRLRQEIAVAQVDFLRASNVVYRYSALLNEKLVSQDLYEVSLGERDMRHAEIVEKQKALAEIEQRMTALRSLGEPETVGTNGLFHSLADQLDEKRMAAATNFGPVVLKSPISGLVQVINHQCGEFVPDGEPLLSVYSPRSDRIVAYLRQPYAIEPEQGMRVEVLTRSRQPQRFQSEISQVGAQVEPITNSLAFVRPGLLVDVGLPIVVNVPPEVSIRPGETVDVLFPRSAAAKPTPSNQFSGHASSQL